MEGVEEETYKDSGTGLFCVHLLATPQWWITGLKRSDTTPRAMDGCAAGPADEAAAWPCRESRRSWRLVGLGPDCAQCPTMAYWALREKLADCAQCASFLAQIVYNL
eukprot:NODE_1788_length_739_cov_49.723856_g1738_i0.p1 GENE.NODE_1788_length_739_cov_49.723856_g1738_i0~~NODE_1788_length_739_cov_49.723856_g1738_i0.p1  ORF type:complete len:107 (+),score=2.35 NODE_1788_length_739_cov_49.723856_g1738_i0:114-434(+)